MDKIEQAYNEWVATLPTGLQPCDLETFRAEWMLGVDASDAWKENANWHGWLKSKPVPKD